MKLFISALVAFLFCLLPLSSAQVWGKGVSGTAQSDLATTALIKKSIAGWSGLSDDAQHIEVVTENGRVTLRGKVASQMEKKVINEIAGFIANSHDVTDLLRIRITTGE